MRAEVITEARALAALEPAWWDLLARCPAAPPFMAPAWLLPWWYVFAPGALHAIAVRDGDRLLALAPLYTEDGAHGRRLLPLGIGLSDMLDVLVDPAVAAEAGAALTGALAGNPGGWACWSAEDAPAGAAVAHLPPPPGWRVTLSPQSACPVLALPPPGTPWEGAIPSGKARKLRMARHRTARRAFKLDAATTDTLPADLDALFRLHAARWQTRGEAGVLADPLVQRFHREAAPRMLAAGLLRLHVLRIDGAVAGVYYGLRHGTTSCAYLGGFDPGFAFESPGTVLIGAALGEAGQEGAATFSFLRGQEAYKYGWGAVDSWTGRCLFEAPR